MSLFTQRITSPTRTFIGVGPNFILSMITICVLGAAATAPGAPIVMTAAIAVDAEIAIERNPDLAINVRSAPDVRHASGAPGIRLGRFPEAIRSEEHTSELQSLMRISYAVFCLKKKNTKK